MAAPSRLNEIYSEDIRFTDPFCHVVGIENLSAYFERMNQRIYECVMVFTKQSVMEDKVYLQWEMRLTLKPFRYKISISGVSVLTIRNKVVMQMDYFNKNDLMFSYVSLLQRVVDFLENTRYAK